MKVNKEYDSSAIVTFIITKTGCMFVAPRQSSGHTRTISFLADVIEEANGLEANQVSRLASTSRRYFEVPDSPEAALERAATATKRLAELINLDDPKRVSESTWNGAIAWDAKGTVMVRADIKDKRNRNIRQEWRSLPGSTPLEQILLDLHQVMNVAVVQNSKVGYDVPPDLTIR